MNHADSRDARCRTVLEANQVEPRSEGSGSSQIDDVVARSETPDVATEDTTTRDVEEVEPRRRRVWKRETNRQLAHRWIRHRAVQRKAEAWHIDPGFSRGARNRADAPHESVGVSRARLDCGVVDADLVRGLTLDAIEIDPGTRDRPALH